MSTINGTDLFLIARGTTNYKVTAADVAAFSVTNGLPSQAGNGGKFLTTDGTTLSWGTPGGGGGGVTGITVTAPITDTGTATAPIIGISAATTGAAGSVQLATLAEAATGTDATKALTPATGVPKTPADMTGAALIPGGDDAARPATPTIGMLRYNNQGGIPGVLEFYDGSGWVTVSTGGFMGNVIYGSANLFATTSPLTITHASVSVANSYILLNTGVRVTVAASNGSAPVGAWISARTATSFTVTWKDNGVTPDQTMSYQIVY